MNKRNRMEDMVGEVTYLSSDLSSLILRSRSAL
jgi:hypothetical protein